MGKFIKGMDVSTLKELEACGARYYDDGVEGELLDILKNNDVNYIRLRLWNDPYSESGEPYGAGTNDLPTTIELAKRVLAKEMGFLLDFHYSDFWTDPGKQTMPKAWVGLNEDELAKALYDFTYDVLSKLKDAGAFPTMIQVGNEMTNGLLWPVAQHPNYDAIIKIVNSGIDAVRAIDKEVPIMLHLDCGGNNERCVEWFDAWTTKGGKDFQIIGLSYYPFWQGGVDRLDFNMNDLAKRYGKEINVVELGMGFTVEDYAEREKLAPNERKGMAATAERAKVVEYPMTKEGQTDFIRDVLNSIKGVYGGLGQGFFYWEPAWIPVPGSGWATPASLEYIKDKGPCGNEWANQALFDYDGNVLPSLKLIRDFK
ncbi:MAG: arabinogalactan endo-beta-1,4-galactanase [Eubacterium sp.]